MLTLNDERLMEDQLLTLASRAERFAAAFTRIFPARPAHPCAFQYPRRSGTGSPA